MPSAPNHLSLSKCKNDSRTIILILTLTLIPKDEIFPNTYFVFSPLISILSSQTNIKTTTTKPLGLTYSHLSSTAVSCQLSSGFQALESSVSDRWPEPQPLGGERILSLSWGV